MNEEIKELLESGDPSYQRQATSRKIQQFGRSIHWIGLSVLGYVLVAILYQAWPVALLRPEWLQKMSQALLSSSFFFLAGIILLSAAPLVDPTTDILAKRAKLAQRAASGLAVLYIILIPVQIYAGVKLLQKANQSQQNAINTSKKAVLSIQQSTTWAEVRQAYSQIPGRKPPIPSRISQPFGEVKDRLTDNLNAGVKSSETKAQQKNAKAWEQWLIRSFVNSLQIIILFFGFAAIGRKSPNQPSLLESIFRMNRDSYR